MFTGLLIGLRLVKIGFVTFAIISRVNFYIFESKYIQIIHVCLLYLYICIMYGYYICISVSCMRILSMHICTSKTTS